MYWQKNINDIVIEIISYIYSHAYAFIFEKCFYGIKQSSFRQFLQTYRYIFFVLYIYLLWKHITDIRNLLDTHDPRIVLTVHTWGPCALCSVVRSFYDTKYIYTLSILVPKTWLCLRMISTMKSRSLATTKWSTPSYPSLNTVPRMCGGSRSSSASSESWSSSESSEFSNLRDTSALWRLLAKQVGKHGLDIFYIVNFIHLSVRPLASI